VRRGGDPRQAHLKDIADISEFDKLEIQHFFEVYKDLEPGKSVEGASWVGREEAEAEVVTSRERYAEDPHAVDHVGDPKLHSDHLDNLHPVRSAQPPTHTDTEPASQQ
jgi:hypothetical protein